MRNTILYKVLPLFTASLMISGCAEQKQGVGREQKQTCPGNKCKKKSACSKPEEPIHAFGPALKM